MDLLQRKIEQVLSCINDNSVEEKRNSKEIYRVSDLERVMLKKSSTIRKNYLATGKIAGSMRNGEWEISASEFNRVADVMFRLGVNYL